jgi:hypothetical protein
MKCELCKCLNIISEGRKHPSQTVWNALINKFQLIQQRDSKAIASLCHYHRNPLQLATDFQSINAFIEEVFTTIENYLNKIDKSGNYKITNSREMKN